MTVSKAATADTQSSALAEESLSLIYNERSPPYAAFAAAKLGGLELQLVRAPREESKHVLVLEGTGGIRVSGEAAVLRHLSQQGNGESGLHGSSPEEMRLVDEWIDFASGALVNGPAFAEAAAAASNALALTTYAAGNKMTAADLAVWGALHAASMWSKAAIRQSAEVANLLRLFSFCEAQPALADAYARLNPSTLKAKADAQDGAVSRGGGDTGSFDVRLPGAVDGKVVTRFPPEPSGYLHIGHAKAALLNQHFADMYHGRLRVRFDDTNPSKESTEFVQNIVDDMARLGLRYDKITHTSDYFPQMIEMARKMIRAGMLYADNTDVDTMRTERRLCQDSKCREMAADEAARIFEEMVSGSAEGATYCLRVRMDMANVNACLRDPVAYRCNDASHWRTGTKFKTYPTYDFACPFVDALEGVTHALRTSEYVDREEQYYRILAMMRQLDTSLPHVHIWDYARLNFEHTVLSKRKLQKLVDTGVVTGWTDPRFPTVQGVLRRGMTLPALRDFILAQGASRNTTLQEWDKIWSTNKKVIDPVAPRHTAVSRDARVLVTLTNAPERVEYATVAKHNKNAAVGKKTLYKSHRLWIDQDDADIVHDGEEVTLMNWGNCIFKHIDRDAAGSVTCIRGELHLDGDFKKTRLKLTWLADTPDLVPLRLVSLSNLITKPKLEEDDEFEDYVNRDSWHEVQALGDPNMRCLQSGAIIQLERKGFYRVDVPRTKASEALLLFAIPDGRKGK